MTYEQTQTADYANELNRPVSVKVTKDMRGSWKAESMIDFGEAVIQITTSKPFEGGLKCVARLMRKTMAGGQEYLVRFGTDFLEVLDENQLARVTSKSVEVMQQGALGERARLITLAKASIAPKEQQ